MKTRDCPKGNRELFCSVREPQLSLVSTHMHNMACTTWVPIYLPAWVPAVSLCARLLSICRSLGIILAYCQAEGRHGRQLATGRAFWVWGLAHRWTPTFGQPMHLRLSGRKPTCLLKCRLFSYYMSTFTSVTVTDNMNHPNMGLTRHTYVCQTYTNIQYGTGSNVQNISN